MALNNHKKTELTLLLSLVASVSLTAQVTPDVPRLVVNIQVDQLRTDYLEAFAPLYGEDGLKRLMQHGRYYLDCQLPFHSPDRASAAACLSTGASPFDNGIPSMQWLSRQTLQPVYCVDDADYAGADTDEKTAPTHLLTTALSDELEMATGHLSSVISVAPERDVAVLLAGHVADGVFWINNQTGNWCGTTFYGEYPRWPALYNQKSPLAKRIGSMTWTPAYEGGLQDFHYFHSSDAKAHDFSHKFAGDRRYRELKTSALINEEVALFVDQCLERSSLGSDHVPDLLNIGLYAGNYMDGTTVQYPSEMQDTYVRLDRALAHIFSSVEQIVGKDGALFVVSSTGYSNQDKGSIDPKKYHIPTGTFDMHRANMLLGMYLSAVYGQAKYVMATHGQQIYLDHKLIEQRQLQLADVLTRAEDFISQMDGVRNVYTSQRLAAGSWNKSLERIRGSWNAKCSGDIIIEVNPGWTIAGETGDNIINHGEAYINYPLIFMGKGIQAERVSTPVSTAAVAPTLSKHLRIRAPNGSSEPPLVLKP